MTTEVIKERTLSPMVVGEEEPSASAFGDILKPEDRQEAIKHLMAGKIIAVECLGPFGLMAAIEKKAGLEKAEQQVNKLGEMKKRDMSNQPAPFFAPYSVLDELVAYTAMTRGGYFSPSQVQESLKYSMEKSGAFFEVVLKPPYDRIIPYTKTVELEDQTHQTGVVACLDESYPALNQIVSQLWSFGRVPVITSANLSQKQNTLTSAREVRETFGDQESDPLLLIVDNPALKDAFHALKIEQSSYTLVFFATGWSPGKEHQIIFDRQGNVDPHWVVELLNEPLNGQPLRESEETIRVVLVEKPFFDLEMGKGKGQELFAIGPEIYQILKPVLAGN